ncbi:MAG: SGNH/GDSL hydrolase family protein [Pirellulaceae bacterium]|nr:SGNH/GDSL hydrolase family protein [Pirellulaceae bacterium]
MSSKTNAPKRKLSKRQRVFASIFGCFLAFAVFELLIRFYPPLELRVRGGRIALPMNTQTVIKNDRIFKIDPEIIHSRNAIGFRGDNPPPDFPDHLTIVTVGGSTTECYYLSDNKTWPEQMRVRLKDDFNHIWVNNAGLDGHSTFGHRQLVQQYLSALKPKLAIFFIGINDFGRDVPRDFDNALERKTAAHEGLVKNAYLWSIQHSATISLLDTLRRTRNATAAGVTHGNVNHSQLKLDVGNYREMPTSEKEALLVEHRTKYLPGFAERVRAMLDETRGFNIEPILMTQPALYGPATDPETGVDLAKVTYAGIPGSLRWELLELYNNVTRDIALNTNTLLIDAAHGIPKNSRLFYDYHHFTNEGATVLAQLVAEALTTFLIAHYPDFCKPPPAQ